jgi:hypothetical protein
MADIYIADSVLRTSLAISSYTTRAHGIIVKYTLGEGEISLLLTDEYLISFSI